MMPNQRRIPALESAVGCGLWSHVFGSGEVERGQGVIKPGMEWRQQNTQQGSKHRQHEKWHDPIKFNYSSRSFILADNFD